MDRLAIFLCSYLSAADDDIVHVVCGIHFHNVPKNRAAADFDHGLWLKMYSFGDSSSESTGYCNRQRFRNAIMFHLGGLDSHPQTASTHKDCWNAVNLYTNEVKRLN